MIAGLYLCIGIIVFGVGFLLFSAVKDCFNEKIGNTGIVSCITISMCIFSHCIASGLYSWSLETTRVTKPTIITHELKSIPVVYLPTTGQILNVSNRYPFIVNEDTDITVKCFDGWSLGLYWMKNERVVNETSN